MVSTSALRWAIFCLIGAGLLSCRQGEDSSDAAGLYIKVRPRDLCLEREVFTRRSKNRLAGLLSFETTAYRESTKDQLRDAIRFSIWDRGRRVDIWRDKNVVMNWYVRKDSRYDQCSWIESPEEISFGPNDVKASARIEQTGPGSWRILTGSTAAPNSTLHRTRPRWLLALNDRYTSPRAGPRR
jgi:hypothetical protein